MEKKNPEEHMLHIQKIFKGNIERILDVFLSGWIGDKKIQGKVMHIPRSDAGLRTSQIILCGSELCTENIRSAII